MKKPINEDKFPISDIGKVSFTDRNLTPVDIMDVAFNYYHTRNKLTKGKKDNLIRIANDLAKLTGGKQQVSGLQPGNKALLLFLIKDKLVTTPEYKDLYKSLVKSHEDVIKKLKSSKDSRSKAGSAASAARKDMKGEFEESVNEGPNAVLKYTVKGEPVTLNKNDSNDTNDWTIEWDKKNKSISYNKIERALQYRNESVNEGKVDLGFGKKGNGTTVWDRNREKNGDYMNVAHISDDGKITWYDKKLPPASKKSIETMAKKQVSESVISEAKIPKHIRALIDTMIERKVQRHTARIKDEKKHAMFMKDVQPAIDQKMLMIKHNPIDKNEMWISLGPKAQIFGEIKEDEVEGGKADGKTLQDVANHHNVDIDEILPQFKQGCKVEREHTDSMKIAAEITLDHLMEDPEYYTKLATIEPEHESVNEDSEYQDFFKKALEKTGKSIPSMSDEEKKKFFDKIDSAWKGKGEKKLVGNQNKLDVDNDGEIEASDLEKLRNKNESVNENSKVDKVVKHLKQQMKRGYLQKHQINSDEIYGASSKLGIRLSGDEVDDVEFELNESINEGSPMDKNSKLKVYNSLGKGDLVDITYDSSIRKDSKNTFVVVKGKTKVGKQKVERITLQVKDKKTVKFYLYQRGGNVTLAMGDMAAMITDMKPHQGESIDEADRSTSPEKQAKIQQLKKLKNIKKNQANVDRLKKKQQKRSNVTESGNEPEIITQLRKIVKDGQAERIKDPKTGKKSLVDMQTANVVTQVYDALKKPANQERFVAGGLRGMVIMAWKMVK